jgi:hypothetical protein
MRARSAAAAVVVVLLGCHGEGRLVRVIPTPEARLAQARSVALVRVTSRDPIELPFKGRTVSCGSHYRAEVIETLKGDSGGALDFVAEEALDVQGEYLVAVRDTRTRQPDPSGEWDRDDLRCRASYERFATGVARVRPGEDGLVVEASRMLPERIREQAVAGELPWPTVKRELFPVEPPLELPPLPPEPEVASPETALEPEAPAATPETRAPAPAPKETAPAPQPPAREPAKKNRWLPWNWDFEWL